MEAAKLKRDQLRRDASKGIEYVTSMLSSEADETVINNALCELNETMDNFTTSQLEYITLIEDEEEKKKEESCHDDMAEEVKVTLEAVARHLKKENEVGMQDSTSQNSQKSKRSSVSSARVQVAVKLAELKAEAEMMERKQELEKEEQRLAQEQAKLKMATELAKAEATEKILSALEEEEERNSREDVTAQFCEDETGTPKTPKKEAVTPGSSEHEVFINAAKLQQAAIVQQRQLIDLMQAPKVEIPVFDGNPLKYYTFIRAFDDNVHKIVTGNSARLTRLIQYCTGKASKVLQCCAIMDPDQGYLKARSLLKERFGNEFVISQAWINKVTTEGSIKPNNGPALQDYADDLRNCLETLQAMDCMSEINTQSTLLKMIARLPVFLQNRWRREVIVIRRRKNRLPIFEDVVKFTEEASLEAMDPIYGNIQQAAVCDKETHSKPKRQASYTVSTTENEKDDKHSRQPSKCVICDKPHAVWGCEEFKKLNPKQRFEAAQKKRLCFNCLKVGHSSKLCRSDMRCKADGCGKKHSSFLHLDQSPVTTAGNQRNAHEDIPMPTPAHNGYVDSSCFTGAGWVRRIALPIVAVKVRAPGEQKYVKTYALLDSGSTNSFCSEELLRKLDISGDKETLSLTTLEKSDSVFHTQVVGLEVSDVYDTQTVTMPMVYSKTTLPIHEENIAACDDIMCWPHLQGLDLPLADTEEVMLLIGQDVPDALIPTTVIAGNKGEPYATKSILGWSLNGPLKGNARRGRAASHFLRTGLNSDERLEQQLEKFWKLENAGLFDEERDLSLNDKRVINQWEKSICYKDGHYELPIPFKDSNPNLPNNKHMAEKRLQSLKRKLERDPPLKHEYIAGMQKLLDNGYAVQVHEDTQVDMGKEWYIPHHPVINPQKEKVRIVFDCAAKHRDMSLNDQVLQGPDLTSKLVGVLMKFRLEEVAFMADVEAMFHQVKVPEEDQDVLRFLWWPGGDTTLAPSVYRLTAHLFGGNWSPSTCNYALQRTASDYGHEFSEETKYTVLHNFYVDDCLKSVATVGGAVHLTRELKQILQRGGFNLTKWISNNPEVLAEIPESDKSKKLKDLAMDTPLMERALGVYWDISNDVFSYNITKKDKPLTKRGLLSMLSSVYDPLGFASPFVLKARIIVQELSRQKLSWDELIPDAQLQQWTDWISDLQNMKHFHIPRCVKSDLSGGQVVKRQLHHFSDASQVAYGVASYLRLESESGEVNCSLIMAKSRLAPIKTISIPRLELSAATLAVRQDSLITREIGMKIDQSHFWTDSTIVLHYISNDDKRYQTFVANRVTIIRSGSEMSQWHHIDTELNPADDTSRGLTAKGLRSSRWLEGPRFLKQAQSEWPEDKLLPQPNEGDLEVKRQQMKVFASKGSDPNPIDQLINACSSWIKLKTSVAWILVIKGVLLHRCAPIPYLQAKHVKEAETEIVKYVQRQAFHEGIHTDTIRSLQPIMRNGVICAGGRLNHAPLDEHFKWPAILPQDNKMVDLLVRYTHESAGHAGREYVLSLIREKYWIVGARRVIRKVLHGCIVCKRREALPCKQQMADLPEDRVTPGDPVFSSCGVDLFGPYLIRRGRGTEKRYGCLFTCLATRAIHIEVVHSLEADSFINCLHRFMARRGKPKLIRSDNGTNFVGAEREIRQEVEKWNKKKIQDEMNKAGIEWKFNPPLASHMGGVWERQIRTVRKVLAGLTKQQIMTEESLHTLLCIAEGIVNNRPITTVSTDPADMEPLTPNHLLLLRPVSAPPGVFDVNDNYSRKKWRQVQYLADLFWRRWTKEYLPQLQSRSKWQREYRNLAIGDIVLLADSSLPRNEWLLGRIIEAYKGRDDKVRSVKVKTKGSELIRPVAKVCLLEAVKTQLDNVKKVCAHPSEE